MTNWIWPVTFENWPLVKEKKAWGVSKEGKGRVVKKGDIIVFYVNGTLHFQGVYKVKDDWHKPTVSWPDRDYISEINLIEIQFGFASLNKLLPSLKFIEKKNNKFKGLYLRGTPQGPANSGKPISDSDYELILNELKKVQEEPNFQKIREEENENVEFVELSNESFDMTKIQPPDKKTLEEIFQDVEKGRCAVPDFQRYWTWSKKQIEELWESIFQKYYVGSLLTWSSSEKKLGKTSIEGGPEPNKNADLVLDGQQRITAIYYAVKAPDKSLPNTEQHYRFFLNINALLDPQGDSSEIIDSHSLQKVEKMNLDNKNVQYKKKIFPLVSFQNRDYVEWLDDFKEYLENNEMYEKEVAKKYKKRLSNIFGYVWTSYEIPVVKLPDSLDLDNVATVFERINSKGVSLGVFDLLNARFTIHHIKLKKQWEEIRDKYENIRKWHDDFKNDKIPLYIVQSLSLSQSGSLKRKQILNLDRRYTDSGEFNEKAFLNDWKEASKYVDEAIAKSISQREEGFGAVKYDLIPYTVTIPLLASLLKEIEDRPDRASCFAKIRFWYWNNVLGDRYSGQTNSTAESDFKLIKKWFKDDVNPFEVAKRDKFNTTKKFSAFYKAVMCAIAKKGALDFVGGDLPLEDHHIFPRSLAEKFNAGDRIDSVLNRTMIFDKTNRDFTNRAPSEYLTDIMNQQKINKGELQRRLSTHLISAHAFECLMKDDFAGFIREREKTVREEFQILTSLERTEDISNVRELLKGEDKNVEYKQTLRYDVRTKQVNHDLEESVMKELACFMNADGGKILIGVEDSGTPTGLEPDYKTFKRQNQGDFLEHLTNLTNQKFGKNANSYIEWSFHQIEGVEICLGVITRAQRPVYIESKNEKKFYVRVNNTCQPLDIKDAHEYILKHWG